MHNRTTFFEIRDRFVGCLTLLSDKIGGDKHRRSSMSVFAMDEARDILPCKEAQRCNAEIGFLV